MSHRVVFAFEVVALVVAPAVICGAVVFAALDRAFGRRDWQLQWDNLADEARSWLESATNEGDWT